MTIETGMGEEDQKVPGTGLSCDMFPEHWTVWHHSLEDKVVCTHSTQSKQLLDSYKHWLQKSEV